MLIVLVPTSLKSQGNPVIETLHSGMGFELIIDVKPGYAYQLQRSRDLLEWIDQDTFLRGKESETKRIPVIDSGFDQEFYRFLRSPDYGIPEEWVGGTVGTKRIAPDQLSEEADSLYSILSSKAFVYLTGTLEQAYHEPVGEVANYFGFAALRNEIRDRAGRLADQGIRGASWLETLEILNASQREILYELREEHEPIFTGFFDTRIELLDELWVVKAGEEINVLKTLALGRKLGRNEAELTVSSAKAYQRISASLSEEQIQAFEDIRNGVTSVAEMDRPGPNTATVEAEIAELTREERDILVAIGSKFIPWVAGTVEGAVELPPGKISNYFGFAHYRYVDRANVSRGDTANQLLNLLNADQKAILGGLAEDVVTYTKAYVDGREDLIRGYYRLRSDGSVDPTALVDAYAETSGIGETQRGIVEALTFAVLESEISAEQMAALRQSRAAGLH